MQFSDDRENISQKPEVSNLMLTV